MSQFLTGTAATGEDLSQTTSFLSTQGTILQTGDSSAYIPVLTSADIEFEAGSHLQRCTLSTEVSMWDSSSLPKAPHLQ